MLQRLEKTIEKSGHHFEWLEGQLDRSMRRLEYAIDQFGLVLWRDLVFLGFFVVIIFLAILIVSLSL